MSIRASDAAELAIRVSTDTDAAERGLTSMSGKVKSSAGGMGAMFASAGLALGAAGFAKGAWDAVLAGSDLGETQSKVGVIFGDSTAQVNAFSDQLASKFGIVKQQSLDAAANIGLIGKASGMTQGQAAGLSTNFVKLATDAASFYNVPFDQALAAMRSGLIGEAEPMRQFGVLLTEDATKQEAYRLGIAKTGAELTEGQKVQARASLMQKGLADANGDLERTQGSLANRLRELKGRFTNLTTELGSRLIPVVQGAITWGEKMWATWGPRLSSAFGTLQDAARPVLDWLNEQVAKIGGWGNVVGIFAAVVAGVLVTAFLAWAASAIASAVATAAAIAPFLLVIAVIAGLVLGFKYLYEHNEKFRAGVDKMVTFIKTVVWPALQQLATFLKEKLGAAVEWVVSIWPKVSEAIGHALNVAKAIVSGFVAAVKVFWDTFGSNIMTVITSAWEFVKSTVQAGVDYIRNLIELVLNVINGDWGAAWENLKGMFKAVWDAILAVLNLAKDLILNALSGLWNGIKAAGPQVLEFFYGLPDRMLGALGNLGGMLVNAGKDIITGLWNGLQSMGGWLWDKVTGFIKDNLPGPVKWALGIDSPSKVMAALGVFSMLGLAQGIEGGLGHVSTAMDKVAPILTGGVGSLQPAGLAAGSGPVIVAGSSSSNPTHADTTNIYVTPETAPLATLISRENAWARRVRGVNRR